MWNFYLKKATILIFSSFLSTQILFSQPKLSFTGKVPGLSNPLDIVNAGDGSNRIFIVQQGGVIKVYNKSTAPPGNLVYIKDFLTVTGVGGGGEQGLLSLAFPPDYSASGYFFVYYVNTSGNLVLARYHISSSDANLADPNSREIVLTISHPTNTNHNGAKLNFRDGYLFFATGDGGGAGDEPNNAQNINSMLGKMIRIIVNTASTGPLYTVPGDNPYVGVAGLDEIYAIGLRNPWRWSFDRANGNMWIGDVGQDAYEEVDYRTPANAKGVNFGWHCYEGTHVYPNVSCTNDSINPIFDYPHNSGTGGYCITGGYVYRGTEYANMIGWYICADYISGNVFKIYPKTNGAGWFTFMQAQGGTPTLPTNISTFGEAEDGTLYAASLTGTVYKLDVIDFSPLPAQLIQFTCRPENDAVQLYWKTAFEENLFQFEIEYSSDGIRFNHAGNVAAANSSAGAEYNFSHMISYSGRLFYRLKMINIDNSFQLSNIVSIEKAGPGNNFVHPSLISNGVMHIFSNGPYQSVKVISMKGEVVLKDNINGRTGRIDIPVSSVPPGSYIVQLAGKEAVLQQKVVIR